MADQYHRLYIQCCHVEIKENISANWEQVGLHQEGRTEKLDPILTKPSNETVVKNTHVKNNAFKLRLTDRDRDGNRNRNRNRDFSKSWL